MSTDSNNVCAVELRGISKRFGNVQVLHNLDIEVSRGEIIALLGPSGCGKSTTLNIIAGFIPPNEGHVFLDGQVVDYLPTSKRNLGMVFQNYSLFPHNTIFDNVAFGLSVRRMKKDEIRERVMWALSLVRLPDVVDRFPAQLSGGQQQRIAVARALVVDPKVLLLDEPLSNLDARLRKEMQIELKRIQHDTGVTMIYVTHDQEEAITMADRLALMRNGFIEQLDNPSEVFERPYTQYAAHFMGFSNFFSGEVLSQQEDELHVKLSKDYVISVMGQTEKLNQQEVTLAIREERVIVENIVAPEGEITTEFTSLQSALLKNENRLLGKIEESVYAGDSYALFIRCGEDIHLQVRAPIQQFPSSPPIPGMIIRVHLPKSELRIVRGE